MTFMHLIRINMYSGYTKRPFEKRKEPLKMHQPISQTTQRISDPLKYNFLSREKNTNIRQILPYDIILPYDVILFSLYMLFLKEEHLLEQ